MTFSPFEGLGTWYDDDDDVAVVAVVVVVVTRIARLIPNVIESCAFDGSLTEIVFFFVFARSPGTYDQG